MLANIASKLFERIYLYIFAYTFMASIIEET